MTTARTDRWRLNIWHFVIVYYLLDEGQLTVTEVSLVGARDHEQRLGEAVDRLGSLPDDDPRTPVLAKFIDHAKAQGPEIKKIRTSHLNG